MLTQQEKLEFFEKLEKKLEENGFDKSKPYFNEPNFFFGDDFDDGYSDDAYEERVSDSLYGEGYWND